MKSIVPRSLFSRLVIVLMGGLVLAQALSLALHAYDRGRILAQTSGVQAAQRIADIVKVLEPLSGDERKRIVSILSAPPLVITLGEPPQPPSGDAEARTRAAFFEAMLSRFLGNGRATSVIVTEATPPWAQGKIGPHEMHGGFGMSTGFKGGPYYGGGPGLSFVAHVTLRDGSGVTFDSRQQPETLNWPYRLLGSFAILLVAVIALSLLAVRWTTRPLKTLAEAAEQLGTNIHSPPLAENGPDEVQRAARAFNTMQAKLITSLRERNQMLAAISHDLKTPITRLKLRAEMLDDDRARSKFAADLDEMEAMVVRTLDFMRGMESSESRQPIDVNALVHSIQSDVQETGGTVEVDGAPRAPYVGQPQALKRCIANLVDNALKYGSAAHVRIEDHGERLVVRVADRGPGIPAASLERVFEPFYRLEGSRNRSTGGTGLGLAIARSVAQNHGGTLCLRNLPEGGLEAVLALPRTE